MRRDVHQAFDHVLDELHEQAERGDAGDVAVELVADLVVHEPDLLPLDQFPLGLVGPPLPVRRRGAPISGSCASHRSRSASGARHAARGAQQAVDDQVRIAPDRRREVRVARERQAEVPQVLRRVARLLHRPQHQHGDGPLGRRAVDLLEQRLEVPRADRVGRRAERVAEARDEGLELLDLQRVGRLVHAVEARNVARLEELGHRLVREQHELLDDPVGDVPLSGDDRLHLAGLVEHDLGLVEVEVDRAEPAPPVVQDPEQLPHSLEHRHERRVAGRHGRVAAGEDRVHVGVGHPLARADDAVVELVPQHRAVAIDLHQARLHEAVDLRVQAAQARRQVRREHVQRAVREVHRRPPLVRLGVERAALAHVVRDVGDVDAETEVAVLQPSRSRSRRRNRARARRRS